MQRQGVPVAGYYAFQRKTADPEALRVIGTVCHPR
jgi:hypothetical protein